MNRDSVLFGMLLALAFSFIVFNALNFFNDILFTSFFEGRRGLSDKFISILTVVSNVLLIGLLNKQFRYQSSKGAMMTTMILVFVVLYFFRNELLG